MFTFVYMKKLKCDTSSLVRISNKHIRLAKKMKKANGVPVGKTFEEAIDTYYAITLLKKDTQPKD